MNDEQFGRRFEDALVYAVRLHRLQKRKVSDEPYIAHLLAVTALVIEDGGDTDEAIAALLHDAVEDQGGLARLDEIRNLFGDRVAEIVDGCSDSYGKPKPPWRTRKERYLEHLQNASASMQRVSLADKLHNARSLLRSLRQVGQSAWGRFNGGKDGTLWYYAALLDFFRSNNHEGGHSPMVAEFAQVVQAIFEAAEED